uniref:Putative secreted protein n=1 Tax=Anopheles darlingi TaxID=43151 RepID=A0A2M4DAB3_ANODA
MSSSRGIEFWAFRLLRFFFLALLPAPHTRSSRGFLPRGLRSASPSEPPLLPLSSSENTLITSACCRCQLSTEFVIQQG